MVAPATAPTCPDAATAADTPRIAVRPDAVVTPSARTCACAINPACWPITPDAVNVDTTNDGRTTACRLVVRVVLTPGVSGNVATDMVSVSPDPRTHSHDPNDCAPDAAATV